MNNTSCPVCSASLNNAKIVQANGGLTKCDRCGTAYHKRCREALPACMGCQPAPAAMPGKDAASSGAGKPEQGAGSGRAAGGGGAPPAPPASEKPRGGARWGILTAIAATAVLIMTLACGLGSVGVYVKGTARDLNVVLTGLAPETPVFVRAGGRAPDEIAGATSTFRGLDAGSMEIQVAPGEYCDPAVCPGPECSSCCSIQAFPQEVAWGLGLQTVSLPVQPPAPPEPVKVEVSAPKLGKGKILYLITEKGGEPVNSTGQEVATLSLEPGDYTLLAVSGRCEEAVYGCGNTQSCPAGCSSWKSPLTVGCGQPTLALTLSEMEPPTVDPEEIRAEVRKSRSALGRLAAPVHVSFREKRDLVWDITIYGTLDEWIAYCNSINASAEEGLLVMLAALGTESSSTRWTSENFYFKIEGETFLSGTTAEARQLARQGLSSSQRSQFRRAFHQL